MSVEMKDSGIAWLGDIPRDWNICRLKNIGELHGRIGWNGLRSDEFEDNSYAYLVTGQDFRSTEIEWNKCYQIRKERYDEDPFIQLEKGDILITKDGTIGKIAVVSNMDKPACLNSGIFVLRQKGAFDAKYLFWFLFSPLLKTFNDYMNLGGTTIIHLYQNVFERMPLLIPPKEEQSRIANFLDKKCAEIDELIVLQEQMIAQLNTYKQAVITETVTKGLEPNVMMKDSGVEWIGEIPEHWSICRIKNLCREEQYAIKTGPFGTQLKGDDLKEEGDVCVYNQRNVIDADFNKVHSYVLIEKANSLKSFFTKPNDLLITTRGTIGRTAVLTKDYPMGILHPCLIALRIKQEISLNWLRYFFQTECFKTDILLSSNATTIEVIYTDNLKKVFVPFPPVVEQQTIAQYLDQKCKEIDDLISIKKEKIEHLKAYKKSVIYEYVTGKKQV